MLSRGFTKRCYSPPKFHSIRRNRFQVQWELVSLGKLFSGLELGRNQFLDRTPEILWPGVFVCLDQVFGDSEYTRGNKKVLEASIIREDMYQASKVFDCNERPHSFKSIAEKIDFEINLFAEGCKNSDPLEKHEVAIAPHFIRQTYNHSNTKKE